MEYTKNIKDRFVLEGQFWFAGDRIFIEVKDEYAKEVYNEISLNDLMKDHIKEESEVRIIIDVKKSED